MPEVTSRHEPFLSSAIAAVASHLDEENFGVAELAEEMNMSRSTLLRRVKAATGLSAAMFIRQQRLKHARSFLQEARFTVSEVAYKTGFSSSSYFAKCYRDEYGYPPGEEGNHPIETTELPLESVDPNPSANPLPWRVLAGIGGILLLALGLLLFWPAGDSPDASPKTIAVLPFQNDSPDTTNVYLINGLMVALIDNLHQIESLQVTSRTTVERYRGISRTAPELAEELGVNYFVEGSGQKVGDKILLTLRLVDAKADTLIWARRYKRETTDIFQLQLEVSSSIAQEIQVVLTPAEQERLSMPPTENLVAYDYFLRGLELIQRENREGLIAGIELFKQAIEEDPRFAHPHAYMAISYYFLDLFQANQTHLEDIITHADRALLLDPDLLESLIGKALYYMQNGQYELSIEFFDKVLERSPDLGWVHNLLSTIYTLHLPNTEQYLRHAIQGIRHATAGQDSNAISMSYLHLGNALTQNGFLKEAEPYTGKALAFNPNNLFAGTLAAYVELAQTQDLELAYRRFQELLSKDSTFLSTLNELGKLALYKGDYAASWMYYNRLDKAKNSLGLEVYQGADINISYVLDQLGRSEEAGPYRDRYLAYLQKEKSIYKELGYATYYASIGEKKRAMSSLKVFAARQDYQFWMVSFIEQDPILQTLTTEPAYSPTLKRIEESFWKQHRRMRSVLETEGVM